MATEEKKPFVKKEFNKDRAPRAEGDRPKFAKGKGGGKGKKRVCFYCAEQKEVDYREFQVLRKFLAENAKILPRRQTGVCAKHQRKLTTAIKTARQMSLLPYVIE
ncbi:MAG: 30S ribosomal protein S18 [Firmicutes bacterium]|nr:30S ribosomal protein S18 [Bacillota bacterium]MCL2771618.1 30S ribosomal protein S18 [Bacillota bacterium]